MSVWRRKELEPITESVVQVQVSQLVAGCGKTHSPADAFSESLQHLQALHEQQVSTLSREVARLRDEVDVLSKGAKDVDFMVGPREETFVPAAPQTELRAANRRWPVRKLRMDAGRSKTKQSSSGSSGRSDSEGNLTPKTVLSAEVLGGISQHLTQFRSERSARGGRISQHLAIFGGSESSARSAMVRISSVGSALLDEYCTYKRSQMSESQGFVKRMVDSPNFDLVMGAIIVLNAIPIGMEATINRAGKEVPLGLQITEYVFLGMYSLELCLRLWAFGRRALCSHWVLFDIFLVCCGCLDVATSFIGPPIRLFENVVLVRTFRLARLARMLRLMIKFHTLWMLVQGLMNSLMTLTWTCIIICILLFVFAVLGLEVLQPDPTASQAYNRVANDNFGGLLMAATSLLQGMTLDSFYTIYRPVMLERPLTIFYFVPFLLVVSIALMNLVTALMVNFSLEQAMKDKQLEEQVQTQQRAEVIRILERAFAELDTNHSGYVDLQEMLAAPEELRQLICEVADVGDEHQADIASIFRMLDFDNTGYVKIEDFCRGLMMLHDHKALESYFVMKYCSNLLNMLKRRTGAGEHTNHARESEKNWSDITVSEAESECIVEEGTTRL